MPDSDPSSTSSARSSRDFPTEEGGDRCRRDGLRLASVDPAERWYLPDDCE